MKFCLQAALFAVCLHATTLRQLTIDDMIAQSTSVVHVKVGSSGTLVRGHNIYTTYQLQVLETLKGAPLSEAAVPGGTSAGIRQEVAGAPKLTLGGEYVLFLWTSNSGLTQIIGLSQGLFNVVQDANGNPVLVRGALTGATTVDKSGQVVNPSAVTISLANLKAEVQKVLGGAN